MKSSDKRLRPYVHVIIKLYALVLGEMSVFFYHKDNFQDNIDRILLQCNADLQAKLGFRRPSANKERKARRTCIEF